MATPPEGAFGVGIAKGDLFVVNEDLDIERLPVGTDGYIIVADSSDPLGLSWFNPLDIPGLGYPVAFGANFNNQNEQGTYHRANGEADSSNENNLTQISELVITKAGNIKRFGWDTESADATTVYIIWVNGVVPAGGTIALTGAVGSVVLGTFIPVAAGDTVAVEYDAGTAPEDSNVQVFVE